MLLYKSVFQKIQGVYITRTCFSDVLATGRTTSYVDQLANPHSVSLRDIAPLREELRVTEHRREHPVNVIVYLNHKFPHFHIRSN